jgi:hypothetical protein
MLALPTQFISVATPLVYSIDVTNDAHVDLTSDALVEETIV